MSLCTSRATSAMVSPPCRSNSGSGGGGGSFSVGAGVMERDAMLQGLPAQFIKFSNPCVVDNCIEGQLPPHLAGPPPPAGTCPTFWAAVDAAFDDSPFTNDGYRNHTLCVDWSNLANSTYTEGPLVVAGSNFDRFLGNGFSDCITPVGGGGEDVAAAHGGRGDVGDGVGDLAGREALHRQSRRAPGFPSHCRNWGQLGPSHYHPLPSTSHPNRRHRVRDHRESH